VTVEAQDKYIKVMADYCADACWNRDGAAMDLDEFPLSPETKVRLREWQWFHDYFGDCHKGRSERKFPDEMFDKWGEILAAQVKKELPDYEVVCWTGSGLVTVP
jgi:hypothetical protein